jgi:predicted DsbA family dithiol-disulfide isomerase
MGYATMVGMSDAFTIDIWSDIVCPFCYLGKKQLDIALTQFIPPVPVEIRLHAFELDPRAPASYDRPLAELLAKKYGVDVEEARRWHRRSEAEAANLGMEWRMDECRTGNTFDAHRLNELAATQGLGPQMNERLMRGYFSEGLLPSDHVALISCATEVGVVVPSDFFASSGYVDEVRHDEARATDLGISGVPSMVLDGRFMLSGAQGVDAMVELLQRAYARRSR